MSNPPKIDIVAYDDAGQPITRQDLRLERRRRPLDNFPFNLLAPFKNKETEKEWDERQLIEAVKERRRRAAGDGSVKPKSGKRRPF